MAKFKEGQRVRIKAPRYGISGEVGAIGVYNNDGMVSVNGWSKPHSQSPDGKSWHYCYYDYDIEALEEFKVGDLVELTEPYSDKCTGYQFKITEIEAGERVLLYGKDIGVFAYRCKLVNEAESQNKLGEEEMTGEDVKSPEYIIIVKNTEVFKKGGVFKDCFSSYSPQNDAFTAEPYVERITRSQVQVLLDKKVAVEAVKFDPEFVTLEQEAVLTKALTDMNKKKPAVKSTKKTVANKKAPAKKGAK